MSSVDDRIVNMQFNNKQFTQGAAESQKALEGLDQTIANTGKGGGLDTMGTAVDGVKAKFSALQVAGVAALATIVSKATNAGIGLIKSLTLDPLTQGFQEYQTNLNSIQTVMANTGKGVNEVNKYMQQLNTYSDQTIYNFSEMAKNIGTFTAAGVDLKTATASIQGIANLAALSGSSSQQASTAMYQLSQAIAAGQVHLQDWNSVVNAGMGGKVFQTALAQNATAMGTFAGNTGMATDKMGKLTINGQSFRESISATAGGASWLTSDVLVKTLSLLDGRLSKSAYLAKGFGDARAEEAVKTQQAKLAEEGYSKSIIKSMTKTADAAYNSATVVKSLPQLMDVLKESIGSIWSNSFSAIMGNFEQSKSLWTSVSKKITGPQGLLTQMGNSWAHMLKGWASQGGRDDVIKGFGKMFNNLGKIFGAVRDAWKEVFPPATKNTLLAISDAFLGFTRHLVLHKKVIAGIRNIFAGIFAVFHIGITLVKGIFDAFKAFFGALDSGGKQANHSIIGLFGSIGKVLVAFDKWLTSGGKLTDSMTAVGAAAGKFVSPIVEGIGAIIHAFSVLVRGGSGADIAAPLKVAASSFSSFISTVLGGLAAITAPFGKISGLFTTLKAHVDGFKSGVGDVSGVAAPIGVVGTVVAKINTTVARANSSISDGFTKVLGAADGVTTSVTDMFHSFNGPPAQSATKSTGLLGDAGDKAKTAWSNVGNVFAALGTGIKSTFSALGKAAGFVSDQFGQLFGGMDALDWASLLNTLFSGALILSLRNFANSFANIGQSVTKTLGAMQNAIKADMILAIAVAIGVLAAALIALSLVNPANLGKSLVAIGTMTEILVIAMKQIDSIGKTTDKDGKVINKFNGNIVLLAASMLILATAMLLMAAAVAIFGTMDLMTLAKGLGAMALVMGLMVVSMKSFSKIEGSVEGMAGSILLIAIAMNAMALAVAAFGNMDMGTLAKGFGAIAIGLGLMVAAMLAMDEMKGSPEGLAASILVMALAMNAMAVAVGLLGSMDMKTLVKGLIAMAIGMGLMVVALALLSQLGPEILVAAASMALISFAMIELATAVGLFGTMDTDTLKKGFIAIAIGLGILLVAAAAAMVVAPGLEALGIAIALIGAGMFLAGVGLATFAAGLAVLATVGTAATGVIVAAIMAFLALLPQMAIQGAAAFVAFIETIAKAAPRLRVAFGKIIEAMLGTITDAIPHIGELLKTLLLTGISVMKSVIPQYIEMGMTVIDAFIGGLSKHIPHIVGEVGDLIVNFIKALDASQQKIITAGTNMLIHFLQGLGKNTVRMANATGQMILDVLNGIDAAVRKYAKPIGEAGAQIARDLVQGIIDGLTGGALSGLEDKVNDVKNLLGSIDLNPLNGRRAIVDPFKDARKSLLQALNLVNIDLGGNDPKSATSKAIKAAQRHAVNASAAASAAAERAAELQKIADKANKKANAKGASQKSKTAARKATAAANKAAATAQSDSNKADAAAQRVQDAIDFQNADSGGRGDIKSQQAQNLADRANQMLAKANAEAKKAKELGKDAGAALMKQAVHDANAAKALAEAAKNSEKAANTFYEKEIADRIKQIQADADADDAARADQAKYDAADQAGKEKILQDRVAADKAAEAAARKKYADLIAAATKLAKTDVEGANKLLDQAETAAQDAQDAADKAKSDADAAAQLLGQAGSTTAPTDAGGIQPSRSVLEDAASAIDRYTESLAQATDLASGNQQVVQYTQNVYSPEPLSPTEVYRQSKNLLAAAEIKMGPIRT